MKNWDETNWGEVVSLEYGKGLRDYQTDDGEYPVFGTNGQIGYTDTFLCPHEGVIVGRKGAYRGIHYSDKPFYVIDTAFYINPLQENRIDLKFAYYKLLTQNINRMDSGSAIPSTSRDEFYQLELDLPPFKEQQEIALILSSLDNKIDLLRNQNETIEKVAQALFKRWFVEFEFPNEEGKPYKSSGGKMVPSELGEIPKGWYTASIKDLASNIQYGYTQSATSEEVGPKFLRITDIQGGKINWLKVPYCEISKRETEKYILCDGDIVVARTGASTGENIYLTKPPKSVFASYLIRFQFEDRSIGRLVGVFMRNNLYKKFIRRVVGGSAQPNANANQLSDIKIIIPNESIRMLYYKVLSSMDNKMMINDTEVSNLTRIRDELLPKLMSGQIRVR